MTASMKFNEVCFLNTPCIFWLKTRHTCEVWTKLYTYEKTSHSMEMNLYFSERISKRLAFYCLGFFAVNEII